MHLPSASPNVMYTVTIIILSLLLLMACKTIDFNPRTYTGDYITIGEGGGIAGIETSYHILPNGKIFKQLEYFQNFTPLSLQVKGVSEFNII